VEDEKIPRRSPPQTLHGGGIVANMSPDAFHIYAGHYYKCKQDFEPPDKYFSPIPYFLLVNVSKVVGSVSLLRRGPLS
jgi:hypothetical protein